MKVSGNLFEGYTVVSKTGDYNYDGSGAKKRATDDGLLFVDKVDEKDPKKTNKANAVIFNGTLSREQVKIVQGKLEDFIDLAKGEVLKISVIKGVKLKESNKSLDKDYPVVTVVSETGDYEYEGPGALEKATDDGHILPCDSKKKATAVIFDGALSSEEIKHVQKNLKMFIGLSATRPEKLLKPSDIKGGKLKVSDLNEAVSTLNEWYGKRRLHPGDPDYIGSREESIDYDAEVEEKMYRARLEKFRTTKFNISITDKKGKEEFIMDPNNKDKRKEYSFKDDEALQTVLNKIARNSWNKDKTVKAVPVK